MNDRLYYIEVRAETINCGYLLGCPDHRVQGEDGKVKIDHGDIREEVRIEADSYAEAYFKAAKHFEDQHDFIHIWEMSILP